MWSYAITERDLNLGVTFQSLSRATIQPSSIEVQRRSAYRSNNVNLNPPRYCSGDAREGLCQGAEDLMG